MKYKSQFEIIYNKISLFLEKNKIDYYNLPNKNNKLPISDAVFCFKDKIRTYKFYLAIEKFVNNNHLLKKEINVIDAGSGIGILGLFALILGVKSCAFIEKNPYSLLLSQSLVDSFKFKNVNFYMADATKFKPSNKFNLLISETIESGLYNEDFTKIINNFIQYGKKDLQIIPEKIEVIMNQINNKGERICIFKNTFETNQGFNRRNVFLDNDYGKLFIKIHLNLFDDIKIQSGNSSFFLNEREFDYKNMKHPIFKFY